MTNAKPAATRYTVDVKLLDSTHRKSRRSVTASTPEAAIRKAEKKGDAKVTALYVCPEMGPLRLVMRVV